MISPPAHGPHTQHLGLRLARVMAWVGAALLGIVLLCVLFIAVWGWNWLRSPLEHFAQKKTGRELVIQGNLSVQFGWPVTHMRAPGLTFANPSWAHKPQMLVAQDLDVGIDVSQLFLGKLVFPDVQLAQAAIALERAPDGRKSWLLDIGQSDEDARVNLGKVTLQTGTVEFDDPAYSTRLHAELTTATAPAKSTATPLELQFQVKGLYQGLAVVAKGSGGPVLALRDTDTPYPLNLEAGVGGTHVVLEGKVTDLQTLSAVDLHMALRGDSLEKLYPLLGIAFPATRPYTTEGHLLHSGKTWRFEKFTGRVGGSDVAGVAQVITGGKRPQLTAELQSKRLALDDLGPVIGARPGSVQKAVQQPDDSGHVLPDLPFNAERWDSVDADVKLSAKTLARAKALPLEDLTAHLRLQDSVLTLEPLNFGLAGGQLNSKVTLNGQQLPIQAHAQVRARKVQLAQLFPTLDLGKTSIGQINGEFDLKGSGNSVGRMVGNANGKLSLVVSNGQISRLTMEKAGLHLWEILSLKLTGDKPVKLRCAVADFDVKQGTAHASALVVDTEVSTLFGTGTIDMKTETLDLVLDNRTKTTSPLALRSPIYVRGSFAQPRAEVDKGRVLTRAAGAIGLGLINPFLTLLPLIDAGPGKDSDCGQLVRDARVWQHKN